MNKKIILSPNDVNMLCLALGYASSMLPQSTALVDRILVQLGDENYTYGKPKAEVIKDLLADGIVIEK